MIVWKDVEVKEVKERLRSVSFDGMEIMSGVSSLEKEKAVQTLVKDDVYVRFNARELLFPLGDLGRRIAKENAMAAFKSSLQAYWGLRGEPRYVFDVAMADTEQGKDCVVLRKKITGTKDPEPNVLLERIAQLDTALVGQHFSMVKVGGDGKNIELQFLLKDARVNVAAGDDLFPGIFIGLNGKVSVAAGVHRLVCANGLTDIMHEWSGTFDELLKSPDMIKRAVALADWLKLRKGCKVKSARELSIALGDRYPKAFLNRYWKTWSERIDLNDLDWYEVINTLTAAVNNTLGSLRYKVMDVGSSLKRLETECRCPTCAMKLE